MKTVIFAYSRQGCATARRVMAALSDGPVCAYTMERLGEAGFVPIGRSGTGFYGELFAQNEALIFVGACGIAVRSIAPYVCDKRTDPAVVCVDERGQFVVPLLSGHIGGANALARRLAEALGAQAVVTTATDVNGKFSVDAWAAEQGLVIDDMRAAKAVSAAVLERDVPLFSEFPVVTAYPAGVKPGTEGEIGICVSCREQEPFDVTLRLVPRVLHLGLGCRKGTEKAAIAALVDEVLRENGIDRRAVCCAASIDLKAEEAGLLSYCEEQGWPVRFYTAQALQAVDGAFTPSAFVKRVTGVDNVCERAALLGAERLLVRKTAKNGVTAAIAAEKLEVRFG